jgi:hypothetical protein
MEVMHTKLDLEEVKGQDNFGDNRVHRRIILK